MLYSKETYNLSRKTLWTVTHLTEDMDSSGTAEDSRPLPDHNLLGQVIVWTSDLSTAAWITALLDAAVTHTDHSVCYDDLFSLFKKMGNQEKGYQMDDPGNFVPLTTNVSYLDELGEV